MILNRVLVPTLRYFTEFGSFQGSLGKSGWRYIETFCSRTV